MCSFKFLVSICYRSVAIVCHLVITANIMDRSPVVIMLYLIFQIKINRELPLIPRNVPLPTPLTLLPSLPLDFQARERVRESDRQTPAESCDMFLGPS